MEYIFNVRTSVTNLKVVTLPFEISDSYSISHIRTTNKGRFAFKLRSNNIVICKRIDQETGWEKDVYIKIEQTHPLCVFNIDSVHVLKISTFAVNTPIQIKFWNVYLSCGKECNIVDFYFKDDNSGRQKWILEKDDVDDSIYYIKSSHNFPDFRKYLGCPNQDNNVYMYSSKNRFTKWKIQHVLEDLYSFEYVGEKFDPNDVCLVVARYLENIDWVRAYNDIAIIYNKGNPATLPTTMKRVVQLHNIGREGHTYLYHIIHNYDALTKYCIFLQGYPFQHNSTILIGIDNYEKGDSVQALGVRYIASWNIPPKEIVDKFVQTRPDGFQYLIAEATADHDYYGEYHFLDKIVLGKIAGYKKRYPASTSLFANFLERSKFPYTKPLDRVRFTWCGLFSVEKKHILKWKIEAYEGIMNELLDFDQQKFQGGTNGYLLERLWLYIFED